MTALSEKAPKGAQVIGGIEVLRLPDGRWQAELVLGPKGIGNVRGVGSTAAEALTAVGEQLGAFVEASGGAELDTEDLEG